jgi:rubrerythrin
LEFAISREVEANQLYISMAKSIENPEMREVCEDLAKEELEHKAKLELELMKKGEVVSDFNISNYVMDVDNNMDMDYEQLLLFAIKKEQLSIDIYTDLAAIVKDKESRDTLLSLAEEETEHKQRFEIEYDRLKTKT